MDEFRLLVCTKRVSHSIITNKIGNHLPAYGMESKLTTHTLVDGVYSCKTFFLCVIWTVVGKRLLSL